LVLRVGCSEDFVTADVDNLTRIAGIAALAVVVVAPWSGYWLAGRATRPLATIARTAARISPGTATMAERVPLRGTGDELDRLAETFNRLLDRLAEHLEGQRAFVANAAHELRSPLAALRASAEVALGRELAPEDYRERLADIVESCDALVGLVNQLLLLAEGEAGMVGTQSPVALDRLAAKVVEMFSGIAESREVTLEARSTGPVLVPGNEIHLRQVISNLVDNALKFTPAGGTVEVEVTAGPGEALLRVRDTGSGIAAADLPHVFERFYRADRARQRSAGGGGFGLGLSICHALVTAHGGQIALASQAGRGTTVTVTLALQCERSQESGVRGQEKKRGERDRDLPAHS
jgi:signal transduction histidine kinase